jgi:tetratricopeptide (TPR) repeat protein
MKGLTRWTGLLFLVLLANSFYLASFATPSIFYMTNVLLHIGAGAVLTFAFLMLVTHSAEFRRTVKWAAPALLASAALGFVLVWKGAVIEMRWALVAHIAIAAVGVVALLFTVKSPWFRGVTFAGAALCCAVLAYQAVFPSTQQQISNSLHVPASMEEEGEGPKSPFWPSSAKTNVGGTIPSNFFMDSKLCGECHKDIYEQWNSSMHHFASFNNQFYRKSIEHMQEISGTRGSKWCAGCHDHAVFFNGRFEKPISGQIDTPEAQNGLGCVSCHSIVHVDGSMGNGGFTIEYPKLHDLASSRNPIIRQLDRFLTYTEPEPHRRTFLKPFMKDSAEFCSTCHKVHLDVPVNNYRWLRGFNDYDNWQASGVSGQGARSFYYPKDPLTCAGCHMPLVPSKDPGHRNGYVHNHRFAAANTAVAHVNNDEKQLKATEGFLKSGFISVDIFAAQPAESAPGVQMQRRGGEAQQELMSTFAVGEEAETGGKFFLREIGQVAAPLDAEGTQIQAGSTMRVDVVVRTRKIGHFFPGGTVDSFDVWLELKGEDATGKTIFWSGGVEDEGKGPVEKGAHFYRSMMLDGDGNPINKRNAWQTRSLLYVRLIPPGAADVAHYRVKVPKDAKGPIKFTAKLNYRKFSWYYTQFVYAGKAKANQDPKLVSIHYDSREYDFSPKNIPANVSGQVKDRIPDLPIVTLAKAEAVIPLAGSKVEWKPVPRKADRERWNDWGIGLFLQGDLKGAEYAFRKVTEIDPDYADGWLNVARALIQEGETEAAKPYVEKALRLGPELGRVHFFKALIEKADGDYDAAVASLTKVAEKYPRDRVVQNQIGRVLFLKRDYKGAANALERVLAVDPEDVQAHYNLMLAYRGMGEIDKAKRSEALFRRFKADESAQTLTAKMRLISPEDNNERQQIHEHESTPIQ